MSFDSRGGERIGRKKERMRLAALQGFADGNNYENESYFDLERISSAKKEHAHYCEAVLLDPDHFNCVPRYNVLPFFILHDIFPKVVDDTEGMFPFLLLLDSPIHGERLCEELKLRFQDTEWYLKPNTVFTPLKSSELERATFQVSRRGYQQVRDKISLYISKLRYRDDRYILEFRRSGRYFQEIPTEFLPLRPQTASRWKQPTSLPHSFLLPSDREESLRSQENTSPRSIDFEIKLKHMLFESLESIIKLDDAHFDPTLSVFRSIVAAVDRARLTDEHVEIHSAPVALWWDVRPLNPTRTSSFEELLKTILHVSRLETPWTSLQDIFDSVCVALTKRTGARISLLVLENSHLLSEDTSALGRWNLLKQCIESPASSTKLVCLPNPLKSHQNSENMHVDSQSMERTHSFSSTTHPWEDLDPGNLSEPSHTSPQSPNDYDFPNL